MSSPWTNILRLALDTDNFPCLVIPYHWSQVCSRYFITVCLELKNCSLFCRIRFRLLLRPEHIIRQQQQQHQEQQRLQIFCHILDFLSSPIFCQIFNRFSDFDFQPKIWNVVVSFFGFLWFAQNIFVKVLFFSFWFTTPSVLFLFFIVRKPLDGRSCGSGL